LFENSKFQILKTVDPQVYVLFSVPTLEIIKVENEEKLPCNPLLSHHFLAIFSTACPQLVPKVLGI
jgi:hypothetical protein